MTICNKIQIVGETMETNLNARGVSCTFGVGTGESTVLDMVEMVNGTNFKGSSDVNLKIGANRPYLLTGETTDVVVKLEDGLCEPLANKNVTIEQSVFIDNGTTASHNDNWYNQNSSFTRTRTDTGTNLKITSPSSNQAYFSGGSGTWASTQLYTAPLSVEFEIIEITTGTPNFEIRGNNTYFTWTCSQVGSYRVEITGTKVRRYFNGTMDTEYDRNMNEIYSIGFRQNASTEFKYKNFKVYEIINGVTDDKGEFALYDVSVTDDTTFTASYGTETATCLVEYCRFVDYAVKDNHNHNYFNQQGTSKVTITEADEYKEFKTISTRAGNVYIGSSTSYNGFDVGDTWTITYDKLYIDGYNVGFQCYNGSTTVGINSTTLGLHNSDFQELKFICDGSSIKAYVDGVYKYQTSYTSTGHGYLRINVNNNNGADQVTFRARNIRIK